MSQELDPHTIELTLKPLPPENVESLKAELRDYIRSGLQASGNVDLLDRKEMVVSFEETIPVDQIVVVVIELATGAALITFEQVIIPWLKRKYEVRRQRKRKKNED